MIPADELVLLAREREIAFKEARNGRPVEGYRMLEASLAVVEALPDEPWLPSLIEQYRRSLVELVEEFNLDLSGPTPSIAFPTLWEGEAQANS